MTDVNDDDPRRLLALIGMGWTDFVLVHETPRERDAAELEFGPAPRWRSGQRYYPRRKEP